MNQAGSSSTLNSTSSQTEQRANGGDCLAEQRMTLADFDMELSFQRGPRFRSWDENPRFRERPRFPVEEIVDGGIGASVIPGPAGTSVAPGKPAT